MAGPLITLGWAGIAPPLLTAKVLTVLSPPQLLSATNCTLPAVVPVVTVTLLVLLLPDQPDGNVQRYVMPVTADTE